MESKLFSNTQEEGDFFGATLSLNSNIIAVGAVYDDVMGSNSGSVSLFSYDNNTWSETEKIVAFDGIEYDFFGNSIGSLLPLCMLATPLVIFRVTNSSPRSGDSWLNKMPLHAKI